MIVGVGFVGIELVGEIMYVYWKKKKVMLICLGLLLFFDYNLVLGECFVRDFEWLGVDIR